MDNLHIRLFGRLRIAFDDHAPEVRITRTTQTLLAYLLLQRSLSSRDVLASLCWGDQPDEQARNCLNTALWRLRRVLTPHGDAHGEYLLTAATGEVGFNWESPHWLDLTAFEQAANRALTERPETLPAKTAAELEQALTLYTGDLLEGFYDDWALRERERVRSMYLDSLARLMRFHHAHGAYAEGLAAGQRLLAHDPLREEIHREMMRLYLKAGERALAVRQYNLCREILADELSIAPMAETEALYHEVLRADVVPCDISGTDPAHPGARTAVARALSQLRQAMHEFDHARGKLQQAVQTLDRLTGDGRDEPKM